MTAPLPPLPTPTLLQGRVPLYERWQMESFAKLAVREALVELRKRYFVEAPTSHVLLDDVINAMLKEYE